MICIISNNITVGFIFGHEYIDEMKNDIYDLNYKIWVIDNLYLQKEHKNKWYWKKLMRKMSDDFTHSYCEIIELTTNTDSSWERFYKKLWFWNASILLCKDI